MQRIDVATAVGALPAPAAQGSPGYFTDGDVVGGEAATVLPADFMNMLQEEILAPVVEAGLTPSKTDHGQMLEALSILFGATGMLAGNGQITIPISGIGKFTFKWGSASTTDTTGTTPIVYPTPFATACFKTWATNAASGPPTATHGTSSGTKTGLTVYSGNLSGPSPSGVAFNWFALGQD